MSVFRNKPEPRFELRHVGDLRRASDVQRRADAALEAEWRRRVARNPTEVARLHRESLSASLRPQALDIPRQLLVTPEEMT